MEHDYDDRFDDPFVPVWEGPTPEAERLMLVVEAAHIPVDLGEATLVGQARVEVPRSYVDDAKRVLARDVGARPRPLDEDEPAPSAMSPGLKLVVAAVVVGLVVALLLTML